MKKASLVKRVAVCILASTLLASSMTGCGKKKEDKGAEQLKQAKEIDKEHIFKEEELEGVIAEDCYSEYLDYIDGKIKCVYQNELEKYTFVSAGADGAIENTFEIPIKEKNIIAHFAMDESENLYVQYSVYEGAKENPASSVGSSKEDAGASDASKEDAGTTDASTGDAGATDASTEDGAGEETEEEPITPTGMIYGDEEVLASFIAKFDNTGKELYKTDLLQGYEGDEPFESRSLVWTKSDGLVVCTSRGIEKVDDQGTVSVVIGIDEIKKIAEWGSYITRGANDQIFFRGYGEEGQVLLPVDLANKKFGESSKIYEQVDYCSFFRGEGYDLYAQDDNYIYGFDAKTDKLTPIINIADSELGVGWGLGECVAVSDTEFYTAIPDENDNYYLAKLTKVNPEDIKEKTVVTLGGVYVDYDLIRAAYKFNKKNDEYRIKIVDYGEIYDDGEYEETVKKFNNDIISGNAPDIMTFDGYLDINSYINKGILMDLSFLFDKGGALENVEVLPNIFEMMHVKDKIYRVFPLFSVDTMCMASRYAQGKTTLTYEDCDEIIKGKGADYKSAFGEITRGGMLSTGVSFSGNKFVDLENRKCDFKNPDFISLLNFANKFPEKYEEEEDGEYRDPYLDYMEDKSIFLDDYLYGFDDYGKLIQVVFSDEVDFVGFPSETGENNAFIHPSMQVGVNSKTANKDVAVEFIKNIFENANSSDSSWGLPVDKTAFEAKKKAATEEKFKMVDGKKIVDPEYFYVGNDCYNAKPITEEQAQKFSDYILSVETLSGSFDMTIDQIIEEEAEAFFSGQKSAEDVADVIQSRVTTYINENS